MIYTNEELISEKSGIIAKSPAMPVDESFKSKSPIIHTAGIMIISMVIICMVKIAVNREKPCAIKGTLFKDSLFDALATVFFVNEKN